MEEEKGVKEVAESETETSDKGAEAPFTSGLQFSAYSRQPQASAYNEKPQPASYSKPQPPPRRADQILYGLDPQGKPVYMDAADVAELLGTPKAKKVKQQKALFEPEMLQAMITFLSGTQESGNPIPSRLQEHFRPPAPRPSLPEWRLVSCTLHHISSVWIVTLKLEPGWIKLLLQGACVTLTCLYFLLHLRWKYVR